MAEPINYKVASYLTSLPSLDFSKAGISEGFKKFISSTFKNVLAVAIAAGLTTLLDNLSAYQSAIAGHEQETLVLFIMFVRALISGVVQWLNTQKTTPEIQG